ncbi:hypothetical protein OBBRIDRAFT_736075 [Obba rivulosa]|uniref:Uncharacterized protein n=1 Tax=Obba rivulosa TaxID=1052685 RepID=A0A8E2AT21_9APHY|nr:hypothetical protein OBBRIDRAFT_736075 [Obba rivulosa]
MNGSSSIGQRSVWSLLDGMRSGSRLSHEAADSENDEDDLLTEYTDDDRSSLMLYGPLVPTTDSEVEIATSEVISISTEDEIRDVAVNNSHPAVVEENTPPMIRPFSRPWPFAARTNRPTQRPSTEAVVERRLWVPSSNKISLQLLWWGYRVYLPPPVLDILNNQRIEATKRAAIITTALKWLLDHIPASAVPLQLRPALELARALVPYLVYVGGFIAWSWTTIKGFDKGHGVVLSATWLLPIALIPGTWEESTGPRPDASASTKRSEG